MDVRTAIYNALYYAMRSDQALTSMVKVRNFHTFCPTGNREPKETDEFHTVDVPYLMLRPTRLVTDNKSSLRWYFTQHYSLEITTIGKNRAPIFDKVTWALETLLAQLNTRLGLPSHVLNWEISESDEDVDEINDDPIEGWQSILSIFVSFQDTHTNMQQYNRS